MSALGGDFGDPMLDSTLSCDAELRVALSCRTARRNTQSASYHELFTIATTLAIQQDMKRPPESFGGPGALRYAALLRGALRGGA